VNEAAHKQNVWKDDRVPRALEVVAREARANRTVVITARKNDGSVETREIEPYSLRSGAPGKAPRLFAFCLKRMETRSWTVTNILKAVPTGKPFAPRWPVEL